MARIPYNGNILPYFKLTFVALVLAGGGYSAETNPNTGIKRDTDVSLTKNGESQSNDAKGNETYLTLLNELVNETSSVLEMKLREMKLKLQAIPRLSTRTKRAIKRMGSSSQDLGLLRGITPAGTLNSMSYLADLTYIKTKTETYLIGAGRQNFDGSFGEVACPIWKWDEAKRHFVVIDVIYTTSAVDVEGFVIKNVPYFVFAVKLNDDLLDFSKRRVRLYKIINTGRTRVVQKFTTVGAVSWKYFHAGGVHYLAQASYIEWRTFRNENPKHVGVVAKGSRQLKLYVWDFPDGFEEVGFVDASYSTDVDAVKIAGRTFLAVVNHTITDKYVESNVLIYEVKEKAPQSETPIQLFQTVTGWAVSDLHFVTVGTEVFLAVAYEFRVQDQKKIYMVDSLILRYNGLFFVKYQYVPTNCAMKWTTLHGANNEVALHLQGAFKERILQFVDDIWSEVVNVSLFAAVGGLSDRVQGVTSIITSIGQNQQSMVAVASKNVTSLFYLNFAVDKHEKEKRVLRDCKNMKTEIKKLRSRRYELEELNKDFVDVNKPIQVITGVKEFTETQVTNLHLENMVIRNTDFFERLLHERIERMESLIRMIDLSRYLTKSSDQVIWSAMKFAKSQFDSIATPEFEFSSVNGIPAFCKFLDKVIWFPPQRHGSIHAHKLQFRHLNYEQGFALTGTLNDLRIPEDVAFLDKHNYVTGRKHFAQVVVNGNMRIKGNINGVNPLHLMRITTDQNIHGDVFLSGYVNFLNFRFSNPNSSSINGIPWTALMNDLVFVDSAAFITGHKTFSAPVNVLGNFRAERLVSGVNVDRLYANAIPLHGPKTFLTKTEFRQVSLDRNLKVGRQINKIYVPFNMVLLHDPVWPVTLNFTTDIYMKNLVVNGIVNMVKLDRNNVMTTTDNQTVSGHKIFHNIDSYTDIVLLGLLNNVNITQLVHKIKSRVVKMNVTYPYIKTMALNVMQPLSKNLHSLLYDTVKTHESYTFPGKVTFEHSVHFRDNLDVPQNTFSDLVPIDSMTPVTIGGKKTFDKLIMHNLVAERDINGISLTAFLDDIMLTVGDQLVTGHKEFNNSITFGQNSVLNGPVNGVNMVDAVKISENASIPGSLVFTQPLAVNGNSAFKEIVVQNLLNSHPVDHWLKDTLLTETDQVITATKHFKAGLNAGVLNAGTPTKNINVEGFIYVNGMNLQDFLNDVILTNESATVFGHKTFISGIKLNNLQSDSIDNVNLRELLNVALKKIENRCLNFRDIGISSLNTRKISTPSHIIEVESFLKDVVYVTDRVLPSNLHFARIKTHFLSISGNINDVKFAKDIVRKSDAKEIRVHGKKDFVANLTMGNAIVNGFVNGVDVGLMDQTAVKQDANQVINGNLVVETLTVHKNLKVEGLVHNVSLNQFVDSILYIDEDEIIKGKKTFANDVIYKPESRAPLLLGGLLDNVNLTYLQKNRFTLDTTQVISAPLIFEQGFVCDNIEASNISMNRVSTVNDVKLPEWAAVVMKTEGSRQVLTAPTTFTSETIIRRDLEVRHVINNVSTKDLITLRGGQTITGQMSFDTIRTNRLKVNGPLMEVNVNQWNDLAVVNSDSQPVTIEGRKRFSTLSVSDVAFLSTVDEISLNDVMTIKGRQIVTGQKRFTDLVASRWFHNVTFNGRLNESPFPLPQTIKRLLLEPYPYPCSQSYIQYHGWCYQINVYPAPSNIDYQTECAKHGGQHLPSFNPDHLQFFDEIKLQHSPSGLTVKGTDLHAFVCFKKARTVINEPRVIDWNVAFDNYELPRGNFNLTSPLTPVYKSLIYKLESRIKKLGLSWNLMEVGKNNTCKSVEDINRAFKVAYRPIKDFTIHDQLDDNIVQIYPFAGQPKFLALQRQGPSCALFQYILKNHRFVKTSEFQLHNHYHPTGNSFIRTLKNGLAVLVTPVTANCSSNLVGKLEIWNVHTTSSQSLMVHELGDVKFACVSPLHVDVMFARDRNYLFIAKRRTLEIWESPVDGSHVTSVLNLTETGNIVTVKAVDEHGHFLVVRSRDDGTRTLTMYELKPGETVAVKTTVYQSPTISFVQPIVFENSLYVIVADKPHIKLLQYDKQKERFHVAQTYGNYDKIKSLHYVPIQDQGLVLVSTCWQTDFVTFDGYLTHSKQFDYVVESQPRVVESRNSIYVTMRISADGYWRNVILSAEKMGPYNFQCQGGCK